MKIKITLEKQEIKDIVKKHAINKFPIATGNHAVYVTESYGDYVVEIEDLPDDEMTEGGGPDGE